MRPVRVLSVASEMYPLVKTGGLADVTGALPAALAAEDVSVSTVLPGYPVVLKALSEPATLATMPDVFGGACRIVAGKVADRDLFVVDAPHLFARDGNPYTGPDGREWSDNAFRFAALCRVAADIGCGALSGYRPDVLHMHDWQAGLTAAYLRFGDGHAPATVLTVHNLAFQGKFPAALLGALRLPAEAYAVEGVEFYDTISFLKAGLQYADRITTVSPTYASEIITAADGMGLDGLLRRRASVLTGVLNGIDEVVWNPATDPLIAENYGTTALDARRKNTATLRARYALDDDERAPLIGVISRLSWQKGLDLLLAALPHILDAGAQVVLLGAGDAALEAAFSRAAQQHRGRIASTIGYDESLAHLIQAGADVLLVPSRFEPCGLTQLCALRYGAVPVVARVGGLADTIVDANEMAVAAGVATGIQFFPPTQEKLEQALARAVMLFDDREAWQRMQLAGMATDVSWRRPARQYAALYRNLLVANGAGRGTVNP